MTNDVEHILTCSFVNICISFGEGSVFNLHSWSVFLLDINYNVLLFFSFGTLKKLVQSLLSSVLPDEKFAIIRIVCYSFIWNALFYSGCFQDFSLYVCLSTISLWWVSSYVLGFTEIPESVNLDLSATLVNLGPLLFLLPVSVATSSGSSITQILPLRFLKFSSSFPPNPCQSFFPSLFFRQDNFQLQGHGLFPLSSLFC